MTDDELAAVIAAVQAVMQSEGSAKPQSSAWKRTAREENVSPFDERPFDKLRVTRV